MTDAIRVDRAVAGYGEQTVLHDVTLSVAMGAWTTIIGANGAGKSTLLKLMAGLLRCREGTVWLDDADVTALGPIARLRGGIGLVPQGRCNFPLLSVAENLRLGSYSRKLSRADTQTEIDRVIARFPRLRERWGILAGNLSGGEQQVLEMAMVLLARPRVLLLDEPSLGLSPQAMAQVFGTIREMTADGLTVVMVEQNAQQALERCDHGVVMQLGRISLTAPAGEVLSHPGIRQMFLGL